MGGTTTAHIPHPPSPHAARTSSHAAQRRAHLMLPRDDPVHRWPCGVRHMAVTCPTRCAWNWCTRCEERSDMPGSPAVS